MALVWAIFGPFAAQADPDQGPVTLVIPPSEGPTLKEAREEFYGPSEATPPIHGEIGPSASPSRPFTSQPSGLPPDQRQRLMNMKDEAAGRSWTLPQLIDEALRRNPSTRVTWQQARSAAFNVKAAEAAYWPTLTMNLTGVASDQTSPTFSGDSPEYMYVAFQPQIQLQWLLFDFGVREADVDAARFALLAENYAFNEQLQNVVLNVMTNYYAYNGDRLKVESARSSLKLSEKTLDRADLRQKSGLGTSTDVFEARQQVAQSKFDLQAALGELEEAKVRLAASLGLPGNAPLAVTPPQRKVNLDVLNSTVDSLVNLALRQRQDLAEAYSNWQSQRADARSKDAAIWPTISLQITADNTFYDAEEEVGGATINQDGDYGEATGLLVFSWDFFDGGEKLNEARSSRALAESAREELANTELMAVAEVVVAYVLLQSATEQVKAGRALVESSRQSFEATNIAYRNGLKNILDLLTAQNNLASAEASLATALTDMYTAAADLADATGSLLPMQDPLAARLRQQTQNP
ncbi:MAG: TolC family protein [Verrucomicrobiota bacterium]